MFYAGSDFMEFFKMVEGLNVSQAENNQLSQPA